MTTEEVVSAFEGKPTGAGKWSARCPAHDDRHASLSIGAGDNGGTLVKCHAGCGTPAVLAAQGLRLADLAPPKAAKGTDRLGPIVKTYPYENEGGELLFQVTRHDPKAFRQRRPDGRGGWIGGLGDVRRVLYNLPRLLAEKSKRAIFITEGEKDCDALVQLGMLATTNPGGVGMGWREEYPASLAGARLVVVIPDRDEPGRKRAAKVAGSLTAAGIPTHVLELPGNGKDVSDWIAAGGTREQLEKIARAAPRFTGPPQPMTSVSQLQGLEALGPDSTLYEVENALRALGEGVQDATPQERVVARERAMAAVARVGKKVVSAPGRFVDAFLPPAAAPEVATLDFGTTVGPSAEAQDGDRLLLDLQAEFERYLLLPEGASVALSLWTLHSWAFAASDYTPRIVITSPTKRCGKTLVLDVLAALCRQPLQAANASAASIFRAIAAYEPTLLLDEADTFLAANDDLRGTLNAGYSRSGFVLRCVDGDDIVPKQFKCFAPVAIAAIGSVPATIEDRSISFQMQRKPKAARVSKFRRADRQRLAELPPRLARWAKDHESALREVVPAPLDLLNDRQADVWEPLFAIGELAGGAWLERARAAAVALLRGEGDGQDRGERLLADLRRLFLAREADWLSLEEIVTALTTDEVGGWGEAFRGKPITTARLANLVRGFGLGTTQSRKDPKRKRGYRLPDLEPVFARYLAPQEPSDPIHVADEGVGARDGVTDQQPQGFQRDFDGVPPTPWHALENEGKPNGENGRHAGTRTKGGASQVGTPQAVAQAAVEASSATVEVVDL